MNRERSAAVLARHLLGQEWSQPDGEWQPMVYSRLYGRGEPANGESVLL